jgi:hypothetical protein
VKESRKPGSGQISSAFDWAGMDTHVKEVQGMMLKTPWILLTPGSNRGELYHDPFRKKTLYSSNSPMEIGRVFELGLLGASWHAESFQILGRVLRECRPPRAKGFLKLLYCYEVAID